MSDNMQNVYVFKNEQGLNWTEIATLNTSNQYSSNAFGISSIRVADDFIAIGDNLDSESGNSVGAVYIFKRDAAGNWNEHQKLMPNNSSQIYRFGIHLDMQEDKLAVISLGASSVYQETLFIYELDNSGNWTEIDHVPFNIGNNGSPIYTDVALDDNVVIVGDRNYNLQGAIYTFKDDGNRPIDSTYGCC